MWSLTPRQPARSPSVTMLSGSPRLSSLAVTPRSLSAGRRDLTPDPTAVRGSVASTWPASPRLLTSRRGWPSCLPAACSSRTTRRSTWRSSPPSTSVPAWRCQRSRLSAARGWRRVDALVDALAPVSRGQDGERVVAILPTFEEVLAQRLIEKVGWRPGEEPAEAAIARYGHQLDR